jgi:thiol-disulfide isomerase/thioredoxin
MLRGVSPEEVSMRAALDAPIRTSASVLDRILASGHPALIVFETPGCEPCDSLHPALEQVAREYHDRVLVVRVMDAAEGWLAARYHLSFVPTLVFWRGAVEHSRIKGNPGPIAIRAHLEFLLTGEHPPDPAEGPRHTLVARFGGAPRSVSPRALLFAGA